MLLAAPASAVCSDQGSSYNLNWVIKHSQFVQRVAKAQFSNLPSFTKSKFKDLECLCMKINDYWTSVMEKSCMLELRKMAFLYPLYLIVVNAH